MLFVNLRPWAKYQENIVAQAQTPPLKGGVWAWTALLSMATVVAYGGDRVKKANAGFILWSFSVGTRVAVTVIGLTHRILNNQSEVSSEPRFLRKSMITGNQLTREGL